MSNRTPLDASVRGEVTGKMARRLQWSLGRWIEDLNDLKANSPEIIAKTIEDLKNLRPWDFQDWVCQIIDGRPNEKKVRDGGIDGYTFEGIPIQVKQQEGVGRPEVERFETVVRKHYYGQLRKDKKGLMIAFSFTSEAYDEASRAKIEDDIDIELKTVRELLEEYERNRHVESKTPQEIFKEVEEAYKEGIRLIKRKEEELKSPEKLMELIRKKEELQEIRRKEEKLKELKEVLKELKREFGSFRTVYGLGPFMV